MTKHTETPWAISNTRAENTFRITSKNYVGTYSSLGSIVFFGNDIEPEREEAQAEANARHIVHCVNLHEELVEILKEIKLDDDIVDGMLLPSTREKLDSLLNKAEKELKQ